MGCGGSKKNERGHSSLVEKQVSVHVGDQVKAVGDGPVIIFVFGGPGSRKGRLVSELVETFGFSFINVEKLLLNHLLKKVPESERVGASFDAQDVIKEDPQLVSLHWLLGEVSRQMEQNGSGSSSRFIVDIMPNLKFLINNDILLADCDNDMKAFEQQHPIAFAINFIQRSAKKNKKESETPKDKEEKPAVRSDEADSSRTRRRITLFDNNVRPFIDYFQQSERLISLDMTGVQMDNIWCKLCELFAGLHISSLAHVNYILVFLFDAGELEQVSVEKTDLPAVSLKSLVEGPNTSLPDTLAALCQYLDRSDPSVRTLLIDVTDTCLTAQHQHQQQTNGHSIVFVDEELTELPRFVLLHKGKGGTTTIKFRAVSSTENRVCLFPCHVPVALCKEVAITLGNHLQR